jgi:hypothetical protein
MQEVTPGILPGSLPPSRVERSVALTHSRSLTQNALYPRPHREQITDLAATGRRHGSTVHDDPESVSFFSGIRSGATLHAESPRQEASKYATGASRFCGLP